MPCCVGSRCGAGSSEPVARSPGRSGADRRARPRSRHMDRADASSTASRRRSRAPRDVARRLEVSCRRSARRATRCAGSLVPARGLGQGAREDPVAPSRVRACASAAVDLGTNTTRLLVADLEDGDLEEVVRREEIDAARRVGRPAADPPSPPAIACGDVLVDYRREAEGWAPTRARSRHQRRAGCGQRRGASSGKSLELRLHHETPGRRRGGREDAEGLASDHPVGSRHARRRHRRRLDGARRTDGNRLSWANSTDAGSVRLTERFLHSDPPTDEELATCAEHVRSLLPPLRPTSAVGVAGTIVTAATISVGAETSVHGHRLSAQAARSALERVASLPLAEREQVAGLHPARAPVIVAGLVVLASRSPTTA